MGAGDGRTDRGVRLHVAGGRLGQVVSSGIEDREPQRGIGPLSSEEAEGSEGSILIWAAPRGNQSVWRGSQGHAPFAWREDSETSAALHQLLARVGGSDTFSDKPKPDEGRIELLEAWEPALKNGARVLRRWILQFYTLDGGEQHPSVASKQVNSS